MNQRYETGCSKVPAIWLPVYFSAFALVIAFFGMKLAIDSKWIGAGSFLLFSLFIGGLSWWLFSVRSTMMKYRIIIDPNEETIEFHYFTFVRRFLPEKPIERMILNYRDILSMKKQEGRGGHHDYLLRTTEGKVTVPSFMNDSTTLLELLDLILEKNRLSPDERNSSLQNEPKVRTPWYAWIILICAIGLFAFIGWKVIK